MLDRQQDQWIERPKQRKVWVSSIKIWLAVLVGVIVYLSVVRG